MTQGVEPHLLTSRLAGVRRRLRLVTGVRGVSLLVTTLVLCVALAGALDWRVHLPGALRAVLLIGALAAAVVVGYGFLVRPLRERTDDLSLALRIEARYPELNDCLASTVQFLGQPDGAGSPAMRRAAVRDALQRAEAYDFNRVVNRRGVGVAGASLVASAALGVALLMLFPGVARTALVRLADPFGAEEWPALTRVSDTTNKPRLARGDAFAVSATVEGVVPEEAVVSLWFEGSPPEEYKYKIDKGSLVPPKEKRQVQRSFRYRIKANDAVTAWREVEVLAPPMLIADGRNPSPRITLHFPKYTELPDRRLPDGAATLPTDAPDTIDGAMPAGTLVTLTALADRPITRAWIEYRPEYRDDSRADVPAYKVAAALAPLGAVSVPGAVGLSGAGYPVWGRAYAKVEGRRLIFDEKEHKFTPWLSGDYAICLEGETGLVGRHLLDVRVTSDPAPLVELRRPSAGTDSLSVLADATITLQGKAADEKYALRSVYLEYRCGKDERPQRLPLYHYITTAARLPNFAANVHLRPQNLNVTDHLPLALLKHADGKPLKEGDTVTLALFADDFDDVALDKKPGRSHEVELRIVGPPTIEAIINQAQAQVQQELHRQRELEREAIKKIAELEKQWKNTGKLTKQDEETLEQARELQQQVRNRLGNKEEGLRAEVARIQQAMRDNHQQPSGTQERLDAVAEELDRLGREELPQIEPLLTDALKQKQLANGQKPEPNKRGPLNEALERQEEVEKTLSDLLARLEPWSTTRQVKGETRALLEEERKLEARAAEMSRDIPAGADPKTLTPEQRAELEKNAEAQKRVAERLDQLLNKMSNVAAEKEKLALEKEKLAQEREGQAKRKGEQADRLKNKDPEGAQLLQEEAEALRKEAEQMKEEAAQLRAERDALDKAAETGRKSGASEKMKQASGQIDQNQLGKARQSQQASTDALEKVAKALEDRREEELDQIIKKLGDAEKELERLSDDQDKLQKKIKEAQQIKDPAQREAELRRLTREQEKLRKDAQELTRTLSRLRSERAREAMSRAAGKMDEAGQELERGRNPEDQQEDALDRLDEARQELKQAREQAEEELAREKLAKVADQIKRLKERQEALLPETTRIQEELLRKKRWDRGLLASLKGHADAQEGLAKETRSLADGKLKDTLVFARVLSKAAEAMEQATDGMRKRFEHGRDNAAADLDPAAEEAADRETQAQQRLALQRMEQLIDALKPEPGVAQRPQKPAGGNKPPMGSSKGGGDGIPHLAQLKALKALQEEVNRRTEDFNKKHPDTVKLADPEKKELDTIRRDQAEVAELLQQITADEGGKP